MTIDLTKVDTLELIYDYLIGKRVNGVVFDSPGNNAVLIVNRNPDDFPVVLAWIRSHEPGKLRVVSPILLQEKPSSVSFAPSKDYEIIDLVEPNSLEKLFWLLEKITNRYNNLAKMMELFGSDLISQANFHVKLAPYQMIRPIPELHKKTQDV